MSGTTRGGRRGGGRERPWGPAGPGALAAGGWWFFGRETKSPVVYLSEAVARGRWCRASPHGDPPGGDTP
jgi:hypothetical protein